MMASQEQRYSNVLIKDKHEKSAIKETLMPFFNTHVQIFFIGASLGGHETVSTDGLHEEFYAPSVTACENGACEDSRLVVLEFTH